MTINQVQYGLEQEFLKNEKKKFIFGNKLKIIVMIWIVVGVEHNTLEWCNTPFVFCFVFFSTHFYCTVTLHITFQFLILCFVLFGITGFSILL